MLTILRNIFAVLLGIFLGGGLNYLIIMYGSPLVPPPEGVDPTSFESIKANIHLYEVKHFIIPFLAHALGTLLGAFTTTKIAATRKMPLAMFIGVWFLIGGVYAAYSLGAPGWMNAADVILAYIPMAWIGFRLGR